jgi:predicted nucleic acid-binding protein
VAGKQVGIALDSSYLIALLCEWHDHHPQTVRSYQRYLDQNAQIIIPGHALLECYSVLTRMPVPYRLPTDTAMQLIEENFAGGATIVGTKAGAFWGMLKNLARNRVGGGQVYDALIFSCAAEAGAAVLLTWNMKHFAPIATDGLAVREP